jgi:hypothetical protein
MRMNGTLSYWPQRSANRVNRLYYNLFVGFRVLCGKNYGISEITTGYIVGYNHPYKSHGHNTYASMLFKNVFLNTLNIRYYSGFFISFRFSKAKRANTVILVSAHTRFSPKL